MKRIRTVAVFPTMFTLGNLVCGFFAIVVAARIERPTSPDVPVAPNITFQNPTKLLSQLDPAADSHNCMLSGWLIFLAMIFDALDGYVARMSRATSDFGAQLDSLCDLVTFGVAPAFLLVKLCPSFTYAHSRGVWILAAAFMACAALRLARFNVETDENDDHLSVGCRLQASVWPSCWPRRPPSPVLPSCSTNCGGTATRWPTRPRSTCSCNGPCRCSPWWSPC